MNSEIEEFRWKARNDKSQVMQTRCGHIWGGTMMRMYWIPRDNHWIVTHRGVYLDSFVVETEAKTFAETHYLLGDMS